MVQPGNKRVQRAKNVHTNGGPMKSGLVPLTGKSVLLFNLPRQCCSHHNDKKLGVEDDKKLGVEDDKKLGVEGDVKADVEKKE